MKKLVIGFNVLPEGAVCDPADSEDDYYIVWPIVAEYIQDEFNWDMGLTFKDYDADFDTREIELTFKD